MFLKVRLALIWAPWHPVASRGWHISMPRNYVQCTTSVIVIMFFITNSLVIIAWQFSCIFLIVLFQKVMATYNIKNLMKREATNQGILMCMQSRNIGSLGLASHQMQPKFHHYVAMGGSEHSHIIHPPSRGSLPTLEDVQHYLAYTVKIMELSARFSWLSI